MVSALRRAALRASNSADLGDVADKVALALNVSDEHALVLRRGTSRGIERDAARRPAWPKVLATSSRSIVRNRRFSTRLTTMSDGRSSIPTERNRSKPALAPAAGWPCVSSTTSTTDVGREQRSTSVQLVQLAGRSSTT